MRGGRFEQRRGDGNVRNAEALLETQSVAEIREVEVDTCKEIQDKQEELRQLVGASYRELIDSADSIVIMGKCCDCIMANLAGMAQGLDSFKQTIQISAQPAAVSSSSRQELYAIGSRVKYLVDTPEKIWGCLDEHMYLEAAERYLRARQVHSLLVGSEDATVSRFPLLRHHWPLVDTFQGQISTRSRERIQEIGLAASDYAVALAAVAIVDDSTSSHIFSLFLNTRKAWLKNYLHAAVSSSNQRAGILCKAIDVILLTLCHIGQLFLEVSPGASPLLFTTALTAPPSSQLFGGISNPDNEVRAWKLHRHKLEASMVPLSPEFVAQESLNFLKSCAHDLFVEADAILSGVFTGKDLGELERSIRFHIQEQAALQDSVEWLKAAFGQLVSSPWDFLSSFLLKTSLNLWDALFEKMFITRMKGIVDSRVQEITITTLVDKYVDSIDLSFCLRQPRIGLLPTVLTDQTQEAAADREWLGELDLYFGSDLKDLVDEGLKATFEDLLMFIAEPRSPPRISLLAPYLRDKVLSCMSRMSEELGERLSNISASLEPSEVKSTSSLINIERALFLGRLSRSLGQHLHYLPVLLGPHELWIVDDKGSSKSVVKEMWSHPETRSSAGGIGFQNLQVVLGELWDKAHGLWVSWSTDVLVQTLVGDVGLDDSKGWQETVLNQESDGSELELKISLPAMASSSAVVLLLVASQEIYRVGGHVLDRNIVQSFATSLLRKVLDAYDCFLLVHSHASERELLRLLFDVRFLADVLAGSKDIDKKRFGSLLSTLNKDIDPIDWATYEPQLWENEKRCYQRCAVLFGFLTQLNRLYIDFGLKNQPGADANIMALSTSVGRFACLPISMPLLGANVDNVNGDGSRSGGWKEYASPKAYENNTYDEATGLSSLKSFMGQVGSRIGEGTLRFGSIIGDGQVGKLRDKSAAAISTFGDILPAFSSLASSATRLEGYEAWKVP